MKKTKHKILKTPFGYFGSKHKVALKILKYLPPHHAWVEVFCGSAAITLAKKPAPIEVINDINHDVVNLFEQLRNNSKKLCDLVALTPYARHELATTRLNKNACSDLEKARRFLVSAMMSINGIFGHDKGGFSFSDSYARGGMEARVCRWHKLPERLQSIVERLRQVRIESVDARALLKQFLNRPATLVYLDPPYLGERTAGYDFDNNNDSFHAELLDLANKAKCMVMISSYENPLYEKMLTGKEKWKKILIGTSTQGSNGKRMERTEILWMNKACCDAAENNAVPISLTKKEKEENKLNPTRGLLMHGNG